MNPNQHPRFLRDPTEPHDVHGSEQVEVGKKDDRKGKEENIMLPKQKRGAGVGESSPMFVRPTHRSAMESSKETSLIPRGSS